MYLCISVLVVLVFVRIRIILVGIFTITPNFASLLSIFDTSWLAGFAVLTVFCRTKYLGVTLRI